MNKLKYILIYLFLLTGCVTQDSFIKAELKAKDWFDRLDYKMENISCANQSACHTSMICTGKTEDGKLIHLDCPLLNKNVMCSPYYQDRVGM